MNINDFKTKPVNQLFFHYLIPAIFGTMVTSIYVLADTVIVGKKLGDTSIAALNIALPIYNIFFGLGLLCGVGGSVLMSISRGKGNIDEGNMFFTSALLLNIIFFIISLVFCSIFMENIAWVLGATEETMPYIMDYIPYIIWGMGAYFFSSFLQTFIRNDGAPKLAMIGVIAGGVTNIILDIVFVFPLNMGMSGAALATVIGSTLTVFILCLHFFSPKNGLKINLNGLNFSAIKRIFENGFTSFVIEAASGFTIFIFNIQLIKYFGNIGVSVYGIICNTVLVVVCLCKGVEQAAQPVLSINYGAGLKERILKVQSLSLKTALIICSASAIIGFIKPELFVYFFLNPTDDILILSHTAIRIYFVGFIFLGINMVFICYFQSVAKSFTALILCLLRGCILVIIFVFILPICLGKNGIWFAFPLSELITLFIGFLLYKSDIKKIYEK